MDDPLAVRPYSDLSNLTRSAKAVDVKLSLQGTPHNVMSMLE
jgi:hypothetical protein